MDHTSNCRPIVGMAAVMTAGAVLLAPTTPLPPKPLVTLSAPQISTQAVHLAALPRSLDIAPGTAAAAAANADGPVNFVDRVLTGIWVGAGAGALFGFVIGGVLAENIVGVLAGNIIERIPVVGELLTPVVQVAAIAGAIVGVPIGAVAGLISAFTNPSPSAESPSLSAASIRSAAAKNKAAVRSTHRSAKRVSPSDRHNSSAPAPSKAAASRHISGSHDTGAGHARRTTPRDVKQR